MSRGKPKGAGSYLDVKMSVLKQALPNDDDTATLSLVFCRANGIAGEKVVWDSHKFRKPVSGKRRPRGKIPIPKVRAPQFMAQTFVEEEIALTDISKNEI